MKVRFFWRLNDEVSVYSTEIIVIVKVLEWVGETKPERVMNPEITVHLKRGEMKELCSSETVAGPMG